MPENQNKGIGFREDHQPSVPKGKNYLLAIGVDAYVHCPRLSNAVKDAKDIVQVLKKRFQFEEANIHELYDKEATKRNIYAALSSMASKVTAADNFVLYFSGHGEYHKIFQLGYWIPIEAEPDEVDQYVPNSEIRNILRAIKSHHTFLMVDSCFSGALFAKSGSRNISLRKERDPSRWGLTAGRNEIVTDGAKGTNSPFAKSILYQLENTNKSLGVAELCDKVLEVVSANADQTPRGEPLKVDGHQGGQFVFHLKKDEVADWAETTETGTLAAYQNFIVKYPDGKYTATAKQKVTTLKAATLWNQIETAPDGTILELRDRLRLVNQYVDAYEDQAHYDEALNYGELLEYKKKFLVAKDSEFALRRFLKKRLPLVKGATSIREEASGLLSAWNKAAKEKEEAEQKAAEADRLAIAAAKEKQEKEAKRQQETAYRKKEAERLAAEAAAAKEKEKRAAKDQSTLKRQQDIANRKKEQERLAAKKQQAAKTPQKTSTSTKAKEPSFFEKNAKYIIPLLILPFLIWGIVKLIPDSGEPIIVSQEMNTFQDEQTRLWGFKKGTLIAIPAAFDSVEDFKNGEASVSKDGQQFVIDIKGTCIRGCPEEKKVSIGTPLQSYKNFIQKGNDALNQTTPDVEAAKSHFQKALDLAEQYKLDDKEAKVGLIKCDDLAKNGTLTDSRDGHTYKWIRLKDDKKWMAENLNYKTADSWCYDEKDSNCRKYGRLYNWAAAKKACPSGWRLPSDDEWRAMAKYYGGCEDDASDEGIMAFRTLISGGTSGFAALRGGIRTTDGAFLGLSKYEKYGMYWSSTENDSSIAWNYYFSIYRVHRISRDKGWGLSCRCIQD